MASETKHCTHCGAELSEEASPQGVCARCLLEAGLRGTHVAGASDLETAPAPSGGPLPHDPGPIPISELSRLFPHLQIQNLLGHGGMGAVYLARHKSLDRPVALKLLAPRAGVDPEFAERFIREARTLARLDHPHIVAVHDFGIIEGLSYFLMEHVDGINLRQTLRKGRLSPRQVAASAPDHRARPGRAGPPDLRADLLAALGSPRLERPLAAKRPPSHPDSGRDL